MSYYEIPQSVIKDDFEFLKSSWKALKSGKLSKEEFKTIRVPFGIYEQREPETYMVRLKTHAGSISPQQLLELAKMAKTYANGSIHVTTRGGLQLHYVSFENLIEVTQKLHKLGLSGRGGGGNTVRNIVSDFYSGIAKDSVFDVAPYANAVTSKMLGLKDSFNLPRKFKIAFSSSNADRSFATITDVGFIATKKGRKKGFIVYIAGGMGSKSRLGHKIIDFLPDNEVFLFSQATKQVFDTHGNRENKHSARLRFLADKIGIEALVDLIKAEVESLRKKGGWEISVGEKKPLEAIEDNKKELKFSKEEKLWWKRFVRPQKQKGYYYAKIPLTLGDIPYKSMEKLAKSLMPFKDSICFTNNQNLILKNLDAKTLLALYPLILEFSPQSKRATIFGDMVACTGAATCQLGIARPRGAVSALEKYLLTKDIDLDILQDFRIHLSGCPNSCGNHFTANLGFFGRILRNSGNPYPGYNVVVGAIIGEGKTRFATKVASIAAFHLPEFVYQVLTKYISLKGEFKEFEDWIDNGGADEIAAIASNYEKVPSFEECPKAYYDWSSDELFKESLKKNGIGEEN